MKYLCPHCFGAKGFLRKPRRCDDWPTFKTCVICDGRGHLTTDDFAKLAKVSRSSIEGIELTGTYHPRANCGARVAAKVFNAIFSMAERERLQLEARGLDRAPEIFS